MASRSFKDTLDTAPGGSRGWASQRRGDLCGRSDASPTTAPAAGVTAAGPNSILRSIPGRH